MNRRAYYTNDSFGERTASGYFYHIAVIDENEAGYRPVGFFANLEEAKALADKHNREHGLSEDDVLKIVASSMRLGRVRRG